MPPTRKNKGRNRRLDRIKRGAKTHKTHGSTIGGKLGRRLMSNATRYSTSRIGRKLLTFWMDKEEHRDRELVVSSHEAKRVTTKFIARRHENRGREKHERLMAGVY